MKRTLLLLLILIFLSVGLIFQNFHKVEKTQVLSAQLEESYWFILHRASNEEFLFLGVPGDQEKSKLVKMFQVKTGVPGKKPTPLPKLVGREYWVIKDKYDSSENPETAPYFLTLDIPVGETEPFGPEPYLECDGQCNWILPGAFGLHGINGDLSKISEENPGSSGCIRHSNEDITYLYNQLNPNEEEIRYYIEDI
jgi:lipoprotein-anchoring transpeptidase ErfK/SrfK